MVLKDFAVITHFHRDQIIREVNIQLDESILIISGIIEFNTNAPFSENQISDLLFENINKEIAEVTDFNSERIGLVFGTTIINFKAKRITWKSDEDVENIEDIESIKDDEG